MYTVGKSCWAAGVETCQESLQATAMVQATVNEGLN